MKFKVIPHTADATIEAYGKDLKQAFENAALAMFEIITDTSKVEEKEEREIEKESEDLQSLLYDFLEELLFLHEVENLLFSRFDAKELKREGEKWKIKAIAKGEQFDPVKHEGRAVIKAVTYHQMKIEQDEECKIRVTFDL